MPCHLRMDRYDATYSDPGDAPQCAGRAIYWANQLKVPRTTGQFLELPPDRERVFSWPHEFVNHHAAGLLAERRAK